MRARDAIWESTEEIKGSTDAAEQTGDDNEEHDCPVTTDYGHTCDVL
jgi:hypothetical protein